MQLASTKSIKYAQVDSMAQKWIHYKSLAIFASTILFFCLIVKKYWLGIYQGSFQ